MAEPHFEQLPLLLVEAAPPTLDSFVPGENAEALAALRAAAVGQGPQFVYLWGPPGSGRTHLLRALVPGTSVRVPRWTANQHLYTVDDVETLDPDAMERLFALMNAVRSDSNSRLVVAGSRTLPELAIRADVKSRLSWGLVFGLKPLDARSSKAEFLRQAQARGIEITTEAMQWIETWCPRDIKSLRLLLDQIDEYSLREQRRVTVPMLHDWWEEREARLGHDSSPELPFEPGSLFMGESPCPAS